jgi:hypothetical protein
MNLVQIQERLKDMPLQAVMQYANGMNPEVPPYLALGELNRRKKMEQAMQPAELPQGTVKEKLEQEVGLAALQKQLANQMQMQGLRQQQAAMSQGQQMARMPGPAPQGVPQPEVPEEVEMADGGVATLMVPDDQFEFGSGGIITFAAGSPGQRKELTEDDLKKLDEIREQVTQAKALEQAFLEPGVMGSKQLREFPERKEEYEKALATRRMLEQQLAQAELGTTPPAPARQPVAQPMAPRMEQRFPPGPPMNIQHSASTPTFTSQANTREVPSRGPSAQTPSTPAPQGIATVAPIVETPATQALRTSIPTQQPTTITSYEDELKKAAEKDPYLTKRPGEKLEQYLATLERRDREDQERFQQMEKERTRSALWKSLMAAGEASRGQRGIGALLGGFGRTAETEAEAARGREEKQQLLQREREMNRVKMAQEIETARIAQSRGDFSAKRQADMEVAKYQQKDREIAGQLTSNLAQIEASNARTFAELKARAEENKLTRETQILVAKIQAAAADRPGETERLFGEYQRLLKADPTGKSAEAYMATIERLKGAGRAESVDQQRLKASLDSKRNTLKSYMENLVYANKPEGKEAIKRLQDEIKAIENQMLGVGIASNAPAGSAANPIKL